MKLFLQITAGALVAGLLLWWMSNPDDFRHKLFGYSQKEIDRSQMEFKTSVAQSLGHSVDETPAQAEAKEFAYQLEAIGMMYGKATASAYQACHDATPKNKKQERDCARLEKKIGQ